MGMSTYLIGQFRTHLMRTGSWTKPTAMFVSLHTGDPALTGANEVSGGAYARVTRAPLDANWTSANPSDNVAAITFPAPSGANWGVVNFCGLWDASTSGNFLGGGAVSPPKTINDGDAAPSFAIGALDVTFS